MAVYPVPTSRSSDLLSRTRMLLQLRDDSLDILRLQTQLSTGLRIQTPSEDPTAALRAQGIQRLLELKEQAATNLRTTQSFLSATDTAVSSVSGLVAEARALAISTTGTTTSAVERQAAAVEIGRIMEQIIDAGNQQFRGRYLFAGSRTNVQPFEVSQGYVAFRGNEGTLRSYTDHDLLFEASIDGNTMFGTISAEQQGTVDLNPILTSETRLADLNGGRGVTPGSLAISDGTNTRIIDISSAETIGNIAELLGSQPPLGRVVTARVGPRGLEIALDAAGGGQLTIAEVGGGTTAAELGIKSDLAVGTGPIQGDDLNPVMRSTTRLADILGTRATAVVSSTGTNNDIRVESVDRGAGENGVTIQYVNDALLHASTALTAGNETVAYSATAVAAQAAVQFSGFGNNLLLTGGTPGTGLNNVQVVVQNAGTIGNTAQVTYDPIAKVLHLGVDSGGATQVQTLVNTINAEGTFTAAFDPSNPSDGPFVPTASISASDAGVVTGDTGNSGAVANTFRVFVEPGRTTANDVVNALSADPMFAARFTVGLDSKDSSSAAFAGQGAIELNATATTANGSGEDLDLASGLQIRNGAGNYTIDVSSATTVEELLNVINGSGANVLAEISATGTAINIRSRLSGTDLSIGENGGTTATQLGVRTLNTDTPLTALNYGKGVHASGGTDFTIHRNDGVDLEINLSSASTLGDVVDLINGHPDNADPATRVVARLAQFGNGIELVDDNPTPGRTMSIEQAFTSFAAEELGLVAKGAATASVTSPAAAATAQLAFPIPNNTNTALRLTATTAGTGRNGVNVVFQNTLVGDTASAVFDAGTNTLTVSLDTSATTANTVLAAVNSEGTFSAVLDTSHDATNNGSGVVGTSGTLATTAGGAAEVFKGSDRNPIEVKGVFNALVRLREALDANDVVALTRAADLLEDSFEDINFARAEIGTRGQALDVLAMRQEDEEVELKTNLADEIEVDLVEAISSFQARQAAYQASLQLSSQLFNMTLLNYL
jgi:flagellin-like hook-associated protein FlgL